MFNRESMRILAFLAVFALISISTAQSIISEESLPDVEVDRSRSRPSYRPKPTPSPTPSRNGGNKNKSGGSSGGSMFLGFILGPILFISAFPCIWYNERRAAIEYRRINLGKEICEDVDIYSQVSAASRNNKLVFARGDALTNADIWDPICGVGGQHLIKITRRVEVLEWRAHTKKENDEEITQYKLEWVSANSSTEGERYNNPANWIIQNETTYNKNVYLGGFNLSKDVVDLCDKTVPYRPNIDIANNISNHFQRNDRRIEAAGDYIIMTPVEGQGYTPPGLEGFDNMRSVNNFDSGDEAVGTLRVKFDLCPIGPISLLAKAVMIGLEQASFAAFNIAEYEGTAEQEGGPSDCGICCCLCSMYKHLLTPKEEFLVVQEKKVEKQDLFDQLEAQTKVFTTVLRILAYVAMVAGICLFFSPITTLFGYIPLVGGFISGIAGFAIFLGALLLCIPLYMIAFSLAWLRFHPKIGCPILTVGLALLIFLWMTSGPPDDLEPPE